MTIQIDNLSETTTRRIEDDARRRGQSVSAVIVELIERQYSAPAREAGPPYRDISDLAGKWTAEDCREFEVNTAQFRQIDEELWK